MANELGATTNLLGAGADLANQASNFVSSGPIGAIGGFLDAANAAVGAASGVFNSIFNPAGIIPSLYKLPLNNVLHNYASYDCIFSLCCLDANSLNYPDTSYMAGIMPTYIFRSASMTPNKRTKLKEGKYEFYCTEVSFKGQYGFEASTANTNTNSFEFTVIEPYSMGQFIKAIQTEAYKNNYPNYNEAPYLFTIEFRGADQSGNMKVIPNTKKFIPFNINNMSIKVNGADTVYTVVGTPCNAVSLTDSVRMLKSDHTIRGSTVQEILQTGENSLQAALNARNQQQKDQNLISVPDEVLILFPNDISSSPAAGASLISSSAPKENDTTAKVEVTQSINEPVLFSQLGVARSSVNNTLVQGDGQCNALGASKLGYDMNRPRDQSFNTVGNVYDKNGNLNRSAVAAPPTGLVDFKFSKDSDIINAINQVMLKSEVAKGALDPSIVSTAGMRPWWRIDVQTYHIDTNANMKTTGTKPKLHVYRVVPYQVHSSRLLPPNAPAPGIKEFRKQAAKVYDYLYSGKNTDVLKFDIDLSNSFYSIFSADNYSTTGDVQAAQASAGADSKEPGTDSQADVNLPTPIGGTPPKPGILATSAKFVSKLTSTDNRGGSSGEQEANRAARLFHDAIINGNDMVNVSMDIVGDPYWIANTGMGNYTAALTNFINVNKKGEVSYQASEVDCIVNFRTPVDINQGTGMYDFKNTKVNPTFSGLYKVTNVISNFKNGQFTQTLTLTRRQGQDSTDTPSKSSLPSSKAVAASAAAGELRTASEIQASLDLGDFAG